ncbi:MAG: hypothetical protein KF862_08455 [Chitinophagaceae bacterium]|nr:hypothetical protein [Chitinophagaceae bacterium]
MKQIFYTLGIAIICAYSVAVPAYATPLVEKKKTYSKSYTVAAGEKIALSNSFGEMRLNTWNKNEVRVDVTIIAKANSEEKAREILDKICIEDGKTGDGVYFKTKMENVNTNNKNNRSDKNYKQEGMEINYNVYLPNKNPVDALNSFGALVIGDFSGEVSLQSKFGSLTAGKLSNVKDVHVEFGKADISWINNGKVNIKFSKANLGGFSGEVNSSFEFCEAVNLKLDNSLTQLNLKSSYSTLEIGLEKNLSADFDIKTSFGDVDNSSSCDIREEESKGKHGPKFDKRYYGTAGKGTAKISIKSDFGKIKLL